MNDAPGRRDESPALARPGVRASAGRRSRSQACSPVQADGSRTGEVRDAVDGRIVGRGNAEGGREYARMRHVIAQVSARAPGLGDALGTRLAKRARVRLTRAEIAIR